MKNSQKLNKVNPLNYLIKKLSLKRVLLSIFILLLVVSLFNFRWIKFLGHLINHQFYIFSNSLSITKENLPKIREKLNTGQKDHLDILFKSIRQ